MSEFELTLLRQRSMEANSSQGAAGRAEVRPAHRAVLDSPRVDRARSRRRIQEALRLVFRKFRDLGSARQVLLWLRDQELTLPAVVYGEGGREIRWKLPVYNTIHGIITNPLYAGAYALRAHRDEGHPRGRPGPQDAGAREASTALPPPRFQGRWALCQVVRRFWSRQRSGFRIARHSCWYV